MLLSSSILLLNIIVVILYYLDLPWFSSCTVGIPLFTLINIVAAHIYRNIRFKVYTDHTITSSAFNTKDLMGIGLAARSRARTPVLPLSEPKANSRHVLDITFKRSTTTSTGTGARRHSYSSIQGGVGRLDLEKQDDGEAFETLP